LPVSNPRVNEIGQVVKVNTAALVVCLKNGTELVHIKMAVVGLSVTASKKIELLAGSRFV
jgi:hypothetical protein